MRYRKKLTLGLGALLAALVLLSVGALAGSKYGSSSDPLVTQSYLDQVVQPAVLAQAQADIDAAVAALSGQIETALADSGTDSYKVVTLSKGQKLTGGVGCEIMLRIGTANCSAVYSPGLVDTTSAGTLNSGSALTKNHLYMVTIDGGGVVATAATTKVLVRGPYTVK